MSSLEATHDAGPCPRVPFGGERARAECGVGVVGGSEGDGRQFFPQTPFGLPSEVFLFSC